MANIPLEVASILGMAYLGDMGGDKEVPIYLAMRIRTEYQLQAKLVGAVLHIAQTKALQDKSAGEASSRLTAEIIDDFCAPPHVPWPHVPWPHVVQQLGELAERYPAGSMLRSAAFDLSQRIVARAAELGKR